MQRSVNRYGEKKKCIDLGTRLVLVNGKKLKIYARGKMLESF